MYIRLMTNSPKQTFLAIRTRPNGSRLSIRVNVEPGAGTREGVAALAAKYTLYCDDRVEICALGERFGDVFIIGRDCDGLGRRYPSKHLRPRVR